MAAGSAINYSVEDWMFFVYDNSTLQSEEDFVGDAIVYFSPSTVPYEVQYTLCGHLAAMNEFCRALSGGAMTSSFCLQDVKVVVKHVEHYTLGLSGEVRRRDEALHNLLNCLCDLFTFYHGSFTQFKQSCMVTGKDFAHEMSAVWECYLPYVKHYGQSVCADFRSLSTLNIFEERDAEIY